MEKINDSLPLAAMCQVVGVAMLMCGTPSPLRQCRYKAWGTSDIILICCSSGITLMHDIYTESCAWKKIDLDSSPTHKLLTLISFDRHMVQLELRIQLKDWHWPPLYSLSFPLAKTYWIHEFKMCSEMPPKWRPIPSGSFCEANMVHVCFP